QGGNATSCGCRRKQYKAVDPATPGDRREGGDRRCGPGPFAALAGEGVSSERPDAGAGAAEEGSVAAFRARRCVGGVWRSAEGFAARTAQHGARSCGSGEGAPGERLSGGDDIGGRTRQQATPGEGRERI